MLHRYCPLLLPASSYNRWFISVESSAAIEVTEATVTYGGQTVLARAPIFVNPDFPERLAIPHPPEFRIFSQSPTSVSPGESNAALNLSIINQGLATTGAVNGRVEAAGTGVVVSNGQGIQLDSNVWQPNELHTLSGPTISVDASHTSSTPVELLLVLTDDLESWEVPFEVAVPWPLLRIVSIDVQNDDDNDGLLEADESAELEITIANIGDAPAIGFVSAELIAEASSTATVVVTNDTPSFGTITVGEVEDEDDFQITVTGGTTGDTVDLLLTMTDDLYSYTDRAQLIIGEPPWISLSPNADADGDAISENSDTVDLLSASYRVVNERLELKLESAVPFNPAQAFIEIWGSSPASDYAYYRWVVQSGTPTMQGYLGGVGFQPLGAINVSFPSTTEMVLDWALEDMDLVVDEFSIGLASGWCGPPSYFCDHYPDGWGYPYIQFSMSNWFSISW